jgi:ATP-dependent 26S proteasome regulatory subunit
MGSGIRLQAIVIEDVELIAQDRSHYESAPLLFELLDAMDGLDEDADLIFVLTTNRPETLEAALASRPGRIDLAVELPLPDAAARRRGRRTSTTGIEEAGPVGTPGSRASASTQVAAASRPLGRR